jgi:hypothetical protein
LQCGNGCSSDPDAKDGVHCTDWKPTNDVGNYGGKCQATRLCVAGTCQITIHSKGRLGFASVEPGKEQYRKDSVQICIVGPSDLVQMAHRIDVAQSFIANNLVKDCCASVTCAGGTKKECCIQGPGTCQGGTHSVACVSANTTETDVCLPGQ